MFASVCACVCVCVWVFVCSHERINIVTVFGAYQIESTDTRIVCMNLVPYSADDLAPFCVDDTEIETKMDLFMCAGERVNRRCEAQFKM